MTTFTRCLNADAQAVLNPKGEAMTPVEELREAAAVMRRDASLAAILRDGDPYYVPQLLPDGSVLSEQPTFERRWHPAVAFAVAQGLEDEAASEDAGEAAACDWSLAVARAYLGHPGQRGALAEGQCVNPDCLAEEGDRHQADCTPDVDVTHRPKAGGCCPCADGTCARPQDHR